MKKVLFVPVLILCLFVSCKKNEVAEKPVDESPAQIVEPVQANVELTPEEKDAQKVEQILNDPNLTVYQKIESLGYQVMEKATDGRYFIHPSMATPMVPE